MFYNKIILLYHPFRVQFMEKVANFLFPADIFVNLARTIFNSFLNSFNIRIYIFD
jgi:hypothetical protein